MEIVGAVLLGLVVGSLVTWAVLRPAASDAPTEPVPQLSEQLREALDMLGSAAIIIGPNDEVLYANLESWRVALVREGRIATDAVTEIVERARTTHHQVTQYIEAPKSGASKGNSLRVRVRELSSDDRWLLIIAEDRSAEERTNQVRRDFIANVSHELKTPVGAVQILAEAIDVAADDPEKVRNFATKMRKESDRLTRLVQQFIDLTKIESGEALGEPAIIRIDEVVAAAISRVRHHAESRRISLATTEDKGLQVVGDFEHLVTATTNLLKNAITYSHEGGRVAITTHVTQEADGPFVEIRIADNGIGIRDEDQERIFERFYRVDYHRNRDYGGSGVGLSLVRHIMRAHGGDVNVWSQLNHGSTFTLWLPAYDYDTPTSDQGVLTDG